MANKYPNFTIIFIPEFLREGSSLLDAKNPSRVVIGLSDSCQLSAEVNSFIFELTYYIKGEPNIQFVTYTEAEAIKMFSNAFLAMRVAFFNELDTFSEMHNLNSKSIISGVCADPRIGDCYNNPSFGYGGYCLPKDTKQLSQQFVDVPSLLIKHIDEANITRKEYIADQIIKRLNPICGTIGIYRLSAKHNSANFRNSCTIDVIRLLLSKHKNIIVFEPAVCSSSFLECEVYKDFHDFVLASDLIIANRLDDLIQPYSEKLYSRDIYNCN